MFFTPLKAKAKASLTLGTSRKPLSLTLLPRMMLVLSYFQVVLMSSLRMLPQATSTWRALSFSTLMINSATHLRSTSKVVLPVTIPSILLPSTTVPLPKCSRPPSLLAAQKVATSLVVISQTLDLVTESEIHNSTPLISILQELLLVSRLCLLPNLTSHLMVIPLMELILPIMLTLLWVVSTSLLPASGTTISLAALV